MKSATLGKTPHHIMIVLTGLLLSGCTVTYKVDPKLSLKFPDQKQPAFVRLQLTDAFSQYNWEHKTGLGDTFRMQLGPALREHAEGMMKSLYQDVDLVNDNANDASTDAKLVFTPRVVSVERAIGMTAFSKSRIVIDLEWKVTNAKGKLVWIQTIQGVGEANTGNMFTHKAEARKQGKRAVEDLFKKSHEAIQRSPEIRVATQA